MVSSWFPERKNWLGWSARLCRSCQKRWRVTSLTFVFVRTGLRLSRYRGCLLIGRSQIPGSWSFDPRTCNCFWVMDEMPLISCSDILHALNMLDQHLIWMSYWFEDSVSVGFIFNRLLLSTNDAKCNQTLQHYWVMWRQHWTSDAPVMGPTLGSVWGPTI